MDETRIPPAAGTRLHPHRLNASAVAVLQTVVGIWLFISPVALVAHVGGGRELVNFMVVGGIMLLTGLLAAVRSSASTQLARTRTQRRWTWVWLIAAAWLLVSPWVLGFSGFMRLTVNAVVCAVIIAALAIANLALTNRMGPDEHKGLVPPSGRLDVDA
jgi:SPW repeat-containing protein